jgi:hypothetical protein
MTDTSQLHPFDRHRSAALRYHASYLGSRSLAVGPLQPVGRSGPADGTRVPNSADV